MLRITRQADYGIVLLTFFARQEPGITITANELARRTRLPAPTVTKILKILARAGMLISHRGVQGGYHLAHAPADLTLAEIISVLDGPIALTQCSPLAAGCDREDLCPVRPNWQHIDRAVRSALADVTLDEMADTGRNETLPSTEPKADAGTESKVDAKTETGLEDPPVGPFAKISTTQNTTNIPQQSQGL